MNPATILLVLQLVEQAITEAPALATDLQNLFKSGAPTAVDWENLRNLVAGETYGQFVPQSDLPPSETSTS